MRRRWLRSSLVVALVAVASMSPAAAEPAGVDDVALTGDGAVWDAEAGFTYGVGGAPCTSSGVGFTPVRNGSVGALDDGFDGGLFLLVNRTLFDDGDEVGDLRAGQQQLTIGPTKIGRLRVTRTERALRGSPTLRTLVRLQNPTTRAVDAEITWDSATGQDDTERTIASSDPKIRRTTAADEWIVTNGTSDNGTGLPDPVLTFAVYGSGDLDVRGRQVPFAPEDPDPDATNIDQGCVVFRFDVRVPAGQTRFLLFFTEMRQTAEEAVDAASRFDRVRLASPLMDGVRRKVARRIANWDF
jgi:hypothetical protein